MGTITLNFLTLPIWWYSAGLGIVISWMKRQYHYGLSRTGLLLFARHMSEPLFGDYTKSGRFVSFFLRIVLLIFKLFVFGLRLLWITLVFALYLFALPASIVMIIYQLFPR